MLIHSIGIVYGPKYSPRSIGLEASLDFGVKLGKSRKWRMEVQVWERHQWLVQHQLRLFGK